MAEDPRDGQVGARVVGVCLRGRFEHLDRRVVVAFRFEDVSAHEEQLWLHRIELQRGVYRRQRFV